MQSKDVLLRKYVVEHVDFSNLIIKAADRKRALDKFKKIFSLLPDNILELFFSGKRNLTIKVLPNLELPFGMRTDTEGPKNSRKYTIIVYEEHHDWPEDRFIGAFLHELGHVVGQRPPENEWPKARGDRARYKEKLEHRADARVWQWGLRHYSMSNLVATYPVHWVEKIVQEISRILLEESQAD